ncbi:MAG: phosphoadenosine phosphosulfate reductase family protein, partial [Gloeomargaritales cyanobacterium]
MKKESKKKLLIAFSGGETSAFMAQWLWRNKQEEYDMLFAFANTGVENEETLNFAHKCEEEFNINVNWLEAVIDQEKGKGTRHKIVD